MSLNGKNDAANNAPKWVSTSLGKGSGPTAKAANNTALYANVTPGAFTFGQTQGVFLVGDVARQNTSSKDTSGSAGWALRRAGAGPILTAAVSGSSGLANGDTITVSGGSSNATLVVSTNSTGGSVTVAPTVAGLFPNTSVMVAARGTTANGTATIGTYTFTLGGRAGRVHYETLVCVSSANTVANVAI